VPDVEKLPFGGLLSALHLVTTIVVAAAVVERGDAFLVTRRQRGVHLEGYWEFPGGKCEPGETHAACLVRELREELAVDALVGPEMLATVHAYPDRRVELHFLRCDIRGEPAPQQGQVLRWVPREELAALQFPPADEELIKTLTARDTTEAKVTQE
jgi:8-oxo-dGTP diphosphatase